MTPLQKSREIARKMPMRGGPEAGKSWKTAGDGKVCKECAAIAANYKGSGSPPAHPNCRCRIK